MTITVLEVIQRALRLCGQSQAPGRGQSAEEIAEGVSFLNQLIDGWNAQEDKIFSQSINRYALVPSQTTYYIGPSGADFIAPRPTSITQANIVQTNVYPEVRIPLAVINDIQIGDIPVWEYATSIPSYLYYSKTPNQTTGVIRLIGYPDSGYDLELYTPGLIDSGLTSASSLYIPEGYEKSLVYSLAEEFIPLYWKKSNSEKNDVRNEARKARAAIVALNSQAPKQGSDAPNGSNRMSNRGPYYSYLTGDGRPR